MPEKNIAVTNRSHRFIGGIKLVKTGLKGIEITYETIEILNGVSYSSEDTKKSKRPVHRELKALVKELTPYLIELLGFPQEGINDLDFEVTGIKAAKDRFLITGMHRCWSDKIIGVSTPLLKEADDYDHYDEVMELVDKIYKETDLYISGARTAKRQEVIVDYMKDIKKSAEFEFSDFENMSKEDQDALLQEIEKDMAIMVHEEDGQMVIGAVEEEEEELNEVVLPLPENPEATKYFNMAAKHGEKEFKKFKKEKEELITGFPEAITDTPKEAKPKKEAKKVQAKTLTQEAKVKEEPEMVIDVSADDDDFELPL